MPAPFIYLPIHPLPPPLTNPLPSATTHFSPCTTPYYPFYHLLIPPHNPPLIHSNDSAEDQRRLPHQHLPPLPHPLPPATTPCTTLYYPFYLLLIPPHNPPLIHSNDSAEDQRRLPHQHQHYHHHSQPHTDGTTRHQNNNHNNHNNNHNNSHTSSSSGLRFVAGEYLITPSQDNDQRIFSASDDSCKDDR